MEDLINRFKMRCTGVMPRTMEHCRHRENCKRHVQIRIDEAKRIERHALKLCNCFWDDDPTLFEAAEKT